MIVESLRCDMRFCEQKEVAVQSCEGEDPAEFGLLICDQSLDVPEEDS